MRIVLWLCLVVFCQAEDGIRDLVRSRGLGDVYKRQLRNLCFRPERRFYHTELGHNWRMTNLQAALGLAPVSYTHLTLPTSDLV